MGAECVRRLQKDYKMVREMPPPYITAHPDQENILIWHYTVEGPPDTPYVGGMYHGKLVFPEDFPYNPPRVYMMTPNGRFKTGQRLCFSMSDFHPKEWNPLWSVSSLLTGLLSFMLEEADTYGSMTSSVEDKREYALKSHAYNLADPVWVDLFPDLAERAKLLVSSTEAEPAAPPPVAPEPASSSLLSADSLGLVVLIAVCSMILYVLLGA